MNEDRTLNVCIVESPECLVVQSFSINWLTVLW